MDRQEVLGRGYTVRRVLQRIIVMGSVCGYMRNERVGFVVVFGC